MLERLRMQEIREIILSVPEGVNITGTALKYGEPILIIEKPGTSQIDLRTTIRKSENGRGLLGVTGQTNFLDFTINEGSIIYALWSYLHGIKEENVTSRLKGTEYLRPRDGKLTLSVTGAEAKPGNIILYNKNADGALNKLLYNIDYQTYYIEDTSNYIIQLTQPQDMEYLVVYDYNIQNTTKTIVKQIHNNIICTVDVYFDAMDMDTDEARTVCLHCERAQILTDLKISANDSLNNSFTPIRVCSIPEGPELNKDIATITVI